MTHKSLPIFPYFVGLYTDEERMLLESVAGFAAEHVAPHLVNEQGTGMYQTGKLRLDILRHAVAEGWTTTAIPERFGGMELPLGMAMAGAEALNAVDGTSGLAAFCVPDGLSGNLITGFAGEDLQAEVSPQLVQGLGYFGLTEPDAGSAIFRDMQTTARREGDDWVINGTKQWITNLPCPELEELGIGGVVFAMTGDRQISAFWVPKDAGGTTYRIQKGKGMLPHCPTGEIGLTNVRVPHRFLVGNLGDGPQIALGTLLHGRFLIGVQGFGLGYGAWHEAVEYATSLRKIHGQPLAKKHYEVRKHLVFGALYLAAARVVLKYGAQTDNQLMASFGKVLGTEFGFRVSEWAKDLLGGNGSMIETVVTRNWRDLQITRIYEGATPVHYDAVARALQRGEELWCPEWEGMVEGAPGGVFAGIALEAQSAALEWLQGDSAAMTQQGLLHPFVYATMLTSAAECVSHAAEKVGGPKEKAIAEAFCRRACHEALGIFGRIQGKEAIADFSGRYDQNLGGKSDLTFEIEEVEALSALLFD